MTNTPEWHRSENEWSILLYTLKQDGWKRGEPVMVNDLTIRIENGPGSVNDLGAIADKLLAALNPAPVTVEAAAKVLLKWCDDRQSEVVNCLDLRADEEASAVLWIENFRNAIRALSGEKS